MADDRRRGQFGGRSKVGLDLVIGKPAGLHQMDGFSCLLCRPFQRHQHGKRVRLGVVAQAPDKQRHNIVITSSKLLAPGRPMLALLTAFGKTVAIHAERNNGQLWLEHRRGP